MTFSFEKDGTVYLVHTKVGNGPAEVHVRELQPHAEEKAQDGSEEKTA